MGIERKIVDLTLTQATDMKFNRRIYPPNAAPEKLESNLQQTKEALEEVFENLRRVELMRKAIFGKVISLTTKPEGFKS